MIKIIKCVPRGTEKVVEKTVADLHDTGCNGVAVRREFVSEKAFVGSMGYLSTINRSLKEAPLAEIKGDAPFYRSDSGDMFAGFFVLTLSSKLFLEHESCMILFMVEKLMVLRSRGLKLGRTLLLNP